MQFRTTDMDFDWISVIQRALALWIFAKNFKTAWTTDLGYHKRSPPNRRRYPDHRFFVLDPFSIQKSSAKVKTAPKPSEQFLKPSSSTNSSVNHLIIFLVNRGVISLAVQVFSTLTFFVWRNTLIWTAFHMAASKVYCNSVLATLNSRFAIRGEATDSELLATTGKLGVDEIYAGTVDDADEERPESPESPPMIPSIGHITESENDSWFGTAKFEEENLSRLSFKRANPHDSRSGIAL
ncbi:hypothetical protein A0H81_08333 [Grifola frondosa]|uniref:DUF6534 domain-containing protein n=1 Tax=Grifola frondosa TaxID=5627 RepID=A0A1C7M496_GRIFR|nr:hypothetical protein A0H81_08333 [Grifola frondosa]